MSINDIPLGRLKEILASDMPLTIVTTEALITRLEQAEAAVARVRELVESNRATKHESTMYLHPLEILRALDGEQA